MTVIDIHTHMFGESWLKMLNEHGGPTYSAGTLSDGRDYLIEKGAAACALEKEAFDYDARIEAMNQHGIDISIVSLTSPNVYWGGEQISIKTAILANDEMAAGQRAYPDRIRWFASIPFEYPEAAIQELHRAVEIGAVGVMATASINGRHLIDPLFAPVWAEIDKLELPVLIHPTAPFGSKEAEFGIERILMPGAGFMFDTTIGIARMVVDGFFEQYQKLKIIASHGGGYLPYVNGRIDMFFKLETLSKFKIDRLPSEYFKQIYYDAVLYDPGALSLCIDIAGPEKVLFGTDFPMPCDVPKLYDLIDSRPKDEAAAIKSSNAVKLFNL
ncbi:MAG: amidohydrolase [Rhodospirillales bacterium]|nr:amidohydrolase [Rhodospirillales bacterium]MBT5430207.1 amidohydrolase [Rhodospirillaceae bacterium]